MTKHKIIIEVREDNKVYVTGPLDKKQLCIAMLEEAKETVLKWGRTSLTIPSKEDIKKLNGTSGV